VKRVLHYKYHIMLAIILMLGFIIRVSVIFFHGVQLTINSDDMGYVSSALAFLDHHIISYHSPDEPTLHIMPGITFLLALIFKIFGYSPDGAGMYVAKMVMIFFGLGTIYVTYLIGKYVYHPLAGIIASFLVAFHIPQVLTNNLLLTENPFIFLSMLLMYYSLKLANTHSMKDFILLVVVFFFALYFRVQIAIYPFILFIYLVLKKYPYKLMWKQLMVSIVLLFIFLGPWWIRNYLAFDEFVFLTKGAGNPLLLGTYQGIGYPESPTIDEIDQMALEKNPDLQVHELMEFERQAAIDRMKEWWATDPKSMIRSYVELKPKHFWQDEFYWIPILGISEQLVNKIYSYIKILFYFSFLSSLLFVFHRWKEYVLLGGWVVLQTFFNCLYFSYNRYALALMPIIFLFIGIGSAAWMIKLKQKWLSRT